MKTAVDSSVLFDLVKGAPGAAAAQAAGSCARPRQLVRLCLGRRRTGPLLFQRAGLARISASLPDRPRPLNHGLSAGSRTHHARLTELRRLFLLYRHWQNQN